MHYRALLFALLVPVAASHAQGTQRALNERAYRSAHAADSTLAVVYRRLEAKYSKDSVALRKLRAAEKAWIAFRDAQIEATYPDREHRKYGSVVPMCVSMVQEELTRARIAQLRAALRPDSRDVCANESP